MEMGSLDLGGHELPATRECKGEKLDDSLLGMWKRDFFLPWMGKGCLQCSGFERLPTLDDFSARSQLTPFTEHLPSVKPCHLRYFYNPVIH